MNDLDAIDVERYVICVFQLFLCNVLYRWLCNLVLFQEIVKRLQTFTEV